MGRRGLTRMAGARAKMVHWWFSWLGGIDGTVSGILATTSTAAGKSG